VTHEHEQLIRVLVQHGADIHQSDRAQKDKPVRDANQACYGVAELTPWCLRRRKQGQSPLQQCKSTKIAALLQGGGVADSASTSGEGEEPAPASSEPAELEQLRAELARVRAENESLKAAAASK